MYPMPAIPGCIYSDAKNEVTVFRIGKIQSDYMKDKEVVIYSTNSMPPTFYISPIKNFVAKYVIRKTDPNDDSDPLGKFKELFDKYKFESHAVNEDEFERCFKRVREKYDIKIPNANDIKDMSGDEERVPDPGVLLRHFKNNLLYTIISQPLIEKDILTSLEIEYQPLSKKSWVVYIPLYNTDEVALRPTEEFTKVLSDKDREKCHEALKVRVKQGFKPRRFNPDPQVYPFAYRDYPKAGLSKL